jgi:hypothetical protein
VGGDEKNARKVLLGKSKGKSPLGTPRRRRKDEVKMGLK